MKFDVTHIDKVLLLQTLYYHADPKGRGIDTYEHKLKQGYIVEGLPVDECKALLSSGKFIDYYNGKPLKLMLSTIGGRTLISTSPYDYCHGKYRFFEALLTVFDIDEIIISEKEYSDFDESRFVKKAVTQKESELKILLDNTIIITNEFGTLFKIDASKTNYKSSFLKELGL